MQDWLVFAKFKILYDRGRGLLVKTQRIGKATRQQDYKLE